MTDDTTPHVRPDDPRLLWNQPTFAGPDTLGPTSSDFDRGGPIPFRHSATHIGGDNVSPELSWNAAPDGTEAVLLAVQDPDAPVPFPFPHCFAVLDPALTKLPQGALDAETQVAGVRLLETRWSKGYFGPAPIEGHGPHRYVFQLFALAEPLELPETVSADDIAGAVRTVLARGRYDGTYER